MIGTKSLRAGGKLIAASLLFTMAGPAASAWADHARLDGDNNPIGEVGPGFGTFPDFPEPAVGPFPDTKGLKFRAQLVPDEINAVTQRAGVLLNDIWGWTSPRGEDYALVGTADGLSIVRVTDPDEPVFIGQVPTADPGAFNNLWGDAAVYTATRRGRYSAEYRDDDDDDGDDDDRRSRSFVYFTTEADGVGINILGLDKLDAMGPAPDPTFKIPPDAVFKGGGYDSSHNISINQGSGFAYVTGVNLVPDADGKTACDGDPNHPSRFNTLILDLRSNPLEPEVAACLADRGEHDAYVVNYRGRDRDYYGHEIAFIFDGRDKDAAGRNGQRVDDTPGVPVGGATEIWDVTDKDDIKFISSFVPPGLCFSHAGWTNSLRHEFLLINDEIDEPRDAEPNDGTGFFRTNFCNSDEPQDPAPNPRLYVMDIRDLDNPVYQETFFVHSPGDNDHNFVRDGNKLYWAIYNGGTRVLEMRKRRGKLKLRDIARLDSEPRTITPPFFNGQWGVFPFRGGRTIVASDIVNGLIVMSLDRRRRDDDDDDGDFKVTQKHDHEHAQDHKHEHAHETAVGSVAMKQAGIPPALSPLAIWLKREALMGTSN